MTNPHDPIDQKSSGTARKVAVAVVGSVVTAGGVVMLVTPGPGIVGVLAGLSILGSEFPAARRTLNRLRRKNSEPDK